MQDISLNALRIPQNSLPLYCNNDVMLSETIIVCYFCTKVYFICPNPLNPQRIPKKVRKFIFFMRFKNMDNPVHA